MIDSAPPMASNGPPTQRVSRHRTFLQKWNLISLPNKFMVISTIVIAFAAGANLIVSGAMWHEMQKGGVDTHTLAEAAKTQATNTHELAVAGSAQALLTKQELEGTMGAVVTMIDFPSIEGASTGRYLFVSEFRNVGHVIAPSVTVKMRLQKMDIASGRRVGEAWPCDKPPFRLAFDPAPFHPVVCNLDGMTLADWNPIEVGTETLVVDGTLEYEDGFDSSVPPQPICKMYEATIAGSKFDRFEDCERVKALWQEDRNRK